MNKRISDRNELLAEKHDTEIEVDADIAAAFNKSTFISRKYFAFTIMTSVVNLFVIVYPVETKGVGAMLLKVGSKRRRTKNEILGEHTLEEERLQEAKLKDEQFKAMEDKLEIVTSNAQTYQNAATILDGLLNSGQVKMDENGDVVVIGGNSSDSFMEVIPRRS